MIRVSRGSAASSFWHREGETLTNGNLPYKCKKVNSTRFSELFLCPYLLKNNQLKIIIMPKRHILVRHILLPSSCWGGRISSAIQGPYSWTKNQTDVRHIDRRKSNLFCTCKEPTQIWKFQRPVTGDFSGLSRRMGI